MSFIELENLSHIYHKGQENEFPALRHVNLSIEEGEFVAILGANGSGKSTLAKHLNALLLPTEGHCRVAGMDTRETDAVWEIRQQVGMVFQNPDNQIIAAIVEDDIAFGPENLGVPPEEIRRRVNEALKTVHMRKYRTFAPHLLSGGQKQRIAIAGALAMETKCLVLDEPTAMLDPQGRSEVLGTVKRLHEEKGITVVYITHFMEEAIAADRIVVMEKGNVVMEGVPKEIFGRPEQLKQWDLDVPLAADISEKLRRKGWKIPKGIYENEKLIEVLVKMAAGGKSAVGE